MNDKSHGINNRGGKSHGINNRGCKSHGINHRGFLKIYKIVKTLLTKKLSKYS